MESFVNNICSVLNKVCEFVENRGYKILEQIIDITPDIFDKEPLKTITSDTSKQYIELLINTLLFTIVIYYSLKLVLSLYNTNEINNLYYFITKVLIIVIISTSSYDIFKEIIDLNYKITNLIEEILENISRNDITYENLMNKADELEEILNVDNGISIDGTIKSMKAIITINMIFALSIRYVFINISIILSPFLIILLSNSNTKNMCIMWIKLFMINLILQIVNKVILFIPIISNTKDEISVIIVIGSLFIMYKINSEMGDIKRLWKR